MVGNKANMSKDRYMKNLIYSLPETIKLEVSKNDLVEFARELVKELYPNQPEPSTEAEIVDVLEAAQITGLARQTIYALTSRRGIPHFKRGKKLWFRRSELLGWMLDNKRKTVDELQKEAETTVHLKKSNGRYGR